MYILVIPLLIIAILLGIYEGGDIFKGLNLSFPSLGEDGLNVRQFWGSPGGTSGSDSPLRYLGD